MNTRLLQSVSVLLMFLWLVGCALQHDAEHPAEAKAQKQTHEEPAKDGMPTFTYRPGGWFIFQSWVKIVSSRGNDTDCGIAWHAEIEWQVFWYPGNEIRSDRAFLSRIRNLEMCDSEAGSNDDQQLVDRCLRQKGYEPADGNRSESQLTHVKQNFYENSFARNPQQIGGFRSYLKSLERRQR
jgi:hypothetical protein